MAQEEGLSLTVLAKTFVRELSHVSREGQDPITLEDLASHQSGLPLVAGNFWQEGDNRYSHDLSGQRWLGYDEAMLTDWLTSTDFRRPESPSYLYSNLGAGVLSVCLAKHDGKSIAEVIEARICEPLGLQDTGFQVEQTVHGYTATLEQTDHWVSADAVFAGAYGLRSTARDMAVFAREVMAMENGKLGRVVVESAKVRGKINDLENTCQGWKRNVFDVLYTTGSTGGFKSAMFLHLPSRTGVVVLVNTAVGGNSSHRGKYIDSLAGGLLNVALGVAPPAIPIPRIREREAFELKPLAGTYVTQSPGPGPKDITVSFEDGHLTMEGSEGDPTILWPTDGERFFLKEHALEMEFHHDAEGSAVKGMTMTVEGHKVKMVRRE